LFRKKPYYLPGCDTYIEDCEARYISALLTQKGGAKAAAAHRAGISYNRLLRLMDKHQIKPRFVAHGRKGD
jgi:DNA-binding NtrC family response regulator